MNQIPQIIHSSWHPFLQELFDDPKMELIKQKCREAPYFPSPEQVFKVFSMPLQDIKVVILGQDPYPKGEAIGYAFAVDSNTPIPASLKIILDEIATTTPANPNRNRNLQYLIDQGVFLLNSALTVEVSRAGSHTDYWTWWTRNIVHIISNNINPVWMLWGMKAYAFRNYVNKGWIMDLHEVKEIKDTVSNYILIAPHPAAQAYDSNTPYKFTGCNHFNMCNKILELESKTQIQW